MSNYFGKSFFNLSGSIAVTFVGATFGLFPFPHFSSKITSYLGSFWSLAIFPLLAIYLGLANSKCFQWVYSFVAQLILCRYFSGGLPHLLTELADSSDGFVWLIVSFVALLYLLPLYLVGILPGSGPFFLWQVVFSTPIRLNAVLYAAITYCIHGKLQQYLDDLPTPLEGDLEDFRLGLQRILGSMRSACEHFEPIVALILSILGARILMNIFYVLSIEEHVRWPQIVSILADFLLVSFVSYLTDAEFLLIDDIVYEIVDQKFHQMDSLSRKQVIHLTNMINDIELYDYVIFTNLLLSSFTNFMTTFLITLIELLPSLKKLVNKYLQDCEVEIIDTY